MKIFLLSFRLEKDWRDVRSEKEIINKIISVSEHRALMVHDWITIFRKSFLLGES